MRLSFALNAIFGSALVIVLIFVDYVRKFSADRFQRDLFCGLLVFGFIPMTADLAYLLLKDFWDGAGFSPLSALNLAVVFFQSLAGYYIVVFVDYMARKDPGRAKKIRLAAFVLAALHTLVLILLPAEKYYAPFAVNWCPALFAAWALLRSRGAFTRSHLAVMFLYAGLSCSGAFLDMAFGTVKLVWPCLAAALLYAYFFILRSYAGLDILTGIGNRFSFNEFTDKLSRMNNGETWAFVMIDMDRFKDINDTLGHLEGDMALRDMAAIIKGCVGPCDFAARYGGDEFVLAVKTETGVEPLMRRIQDAVDEYNAKQLRPFKLELSYGYDVYTADGSRSLDEFLVHLDGLMYKHKRERRRSSDKKAGAAV